jgi:dTDP-4-dehydrorhamnose 3,5-epimerase
MTTPFIFPLQNAKPREDERGSLQILYERGGIVLKRSFSRKGVFRGMHIQMPPHAQTKIIRVISGSIIDFVLDMSGPQRKLDWRRLDSRDEWVEIAPQFAHGFYALEDTVFEYICDGAYAEGAEKSLSIAEVIEQVLQIRDMIISEKDKKGEKLSVADIVLPPGRAADGA